VYVCGGRGGGRGQTVCQHKGEGMERQVATAQRRMVLARLMGMECWLCAALHSCSTPCLEALADQANQPVFL
jgi:hypothetical protein